MLKLRRQKSESDVLIDDEMDGMDSELEMTGWYSVFTACVIS